MEPVEIYYCTELVKHITAHWVSQTQKTIKLQMFSSLPTQGAPRKNVKNDNDLKTSPRQAAWKKSAEKALNRNSEHLLETYLLLCLWPPFTQWELMFNLSKFVIFWRLVVFRNISQRFDSISGMWSMTLVWNQRTTLENGGGGRKKRRPRRSHRWASINGQRGGVCALSHALSGLGTSERLSQAYCNNTNMDGTNKQCL